MLRQRTPGNLGMASHRGLHEPGGGGGLARAGHHLRLKAYTLDSMGLGLSALWAVEHGRRLAEEAADM